MSEDTAILLSALREESTGKRFRSRKNKVYLSAYNGEPVVVKELPDSETASKEHALLSLCVAGGVPVPRPLAVVGSALVLEHVEGGTVAELLDSIWLRETSPSVDELALLADVASSLGEWLAGFHRLSEFRVVRGDANMRNFIMRGRSVVGIDFEESEESDVIDDLGQMCSSALSMNPMFTPEKLDFCRKMSDTYFGLAGTDRTNALNQATVKALRYYAAFRDDGHKMIEFASSIEESGFLSEKQ